MVLKMWQLVFVGLKWFLAQKNDGSIFDIGEITTPSFMEPAGGPTNWMLIVFWLICSLLVVILHVFIAVWIYQDGKAKGKSAGGWAVFGAIPIIGLVGLFTYALSKPTNICQIHNQPLMAGSQECAVCYQERRIREIEQQRIATPSGESPESTSPIFQPGGGTARPGADPTKTQPIKIKPSTIISLLQLNGQRRGMTTNLTIKNPLTGALEKNTIGRHPECNVSIPEDETISRRHCSLGGDEQGKYYVADLDSENGTSIIRGNEKIGVAQGGRQEIRDGDVLKVANTEFRIVIVKPPEEQFK